MSDWISWTKCPECGGAAAVGWVEDQLVEIDCVEACPLPQPSHHSDLGGHATTLASTRTGWPAT